jgi:tetratricopeptide (TPR) repeat protein
MSAVPYTFANNYGNIPLSQLDVNFANCKAKADLAGYVTANAQSNITSIGTLTSLSVTGNVKCGNVNTGGNVTTSKWLLATTGVSTVGNILGNTISASGNITSPSGIFTNLTTSGNLNITGNFVVADTLISSAISSHENIDLALSLSNIGLIYYAQQNLKLSIEYLEKAYKIYEKCDNQKKAVEILKVLNTIRMSHTKICNFFNF